MSETTPTLETVGAPEGHNEAMIAKFDAAQGTPQAPVETPKADEAAPPAKPEWLPGKFWRDGKADYEGLTNSYKELEKTRGTKPETAAEVPPEAAAVATKDDAAQALQSVGLDYSAISARYQENGSLLASDRAALNKAGVPDAMIDAYVAGQQAQLDAFTNSLLAEVGGREEYERLSKWAGNGGLTKAEAEAYNRVMQGNDPEAAKLAIAGLKAKHDAKMGVDPQLVTAQTGPGSAGDVFKSSAQLVAAMSDPRYKTDQAYRDEVTEKLSRSKIM